MEQFSDIMVSEEWQGGWLTFAVTHLATFFSILQLICNRNTKLEGLLTIFE